MEQNIRWEEMLHEKEMATLHLEANKAKAEGLDRPVVGIIKKGELRCPNFPSSAKQKTVSMLI